MADKALVRDVVSRGSQLRRDRRTTGGSRRARRCSGRAGGTRRASASRAERRTSPRNLEKQGRCQLT